MMKALAIAVTLACAVIAGVALSTLDFAAGATQNGAAQSVETIIPLEGLDPVLLTQGKEVQGDVKFAVTRGGFRYLFASAENKASFEKEPERFEIQLGGMCARMGPGAQGNPDLFSVYKERIYIFGSPECVNLFKASPESYLEPDPAPVLKPASAEDLRKGAALIEKAVDAAGGASKIDALASYQEKATTARRTHEGLAQIKTALFIVYPDRIRQERVMPFGTLATVVTPSEGFVATSSGGGGDMIRAQRAAIEKQLKRNIISVLRSRRSGDFVAAALRAGKVGESNVELVAASFDGLSVVLGIDPANGRVLSLSYRGRGPDGKFGEIAQTFSDFRTTDGLTLPFKTEGTFNGVAEPAFSSTIESIVINGAVSPALFEKPKPATAQQ